MRLARAFGAVLAFAAAAVLGCEGLIDADFDVERVSCTHRRPNPPPPPGNYGGGPPIVLAVRQIFLGLDDDSYLNTGLDFDGLCTNRSQGPSCKTASWPRDVNGAAFADGTDGTDGIDNGLGRLVKAQERVFRATFFSESNLNARIESGETPPFCVLRITGYNPAAPDDGDVRVELFLPASETSTPWPATGRKTVNLDARTAWRPDPGGDIQSRIVDEAAYMSGGVLVAHFKPVNGVRPSIRLGAVAFSFEDLTLMATFPQLGRTIESVQLAGKVTVREMLQQLGPLTDPSASGTGLCTNSPSYPRVKGYFCGFADLRTDGLIDANATCDALGLGMRLRTVEAALGEIRPAEVLTACPPETAPANEDCATSAIVVGAVDASAPPISDGGSDGSTPIVNCVAPGTPNNEVGVGGACTKASECPKSLCSAEFGAPAGNYFCTTICNGATDTSCGKGMRCAKQTEASSFYGCVPEVCLPDAGR